MEIKDNPLRYEKYETRLEDMVDVCHGKMNIDELYREIAVYMGLYNPSKMIIDIERRDDKKGYYSIIYIPKRDFWRKDDK